MKVKQKKSWRKLSSESVCTPVHQMKPKTRELDSSPSSTPARIPPVIGLRLNYISPLGNSAGAKKKKDKTPAKQKTDSPIAPEGGSRKARRKRRSQAADKTLDDTTELIVIPDTPTLLGNAISDVSVEEPAEPRVDDIEVSPMTATTKPAKRKKKGRSRDRSAQANDASVVITDDSPSSSSGRWAVKNSVCSDEVEESEDVDEQNKGEVADVDLSTPTPPSKKKRKKVSCEADITEVASLLRKKRRVTVGDTGEVLATIDNADAAENVTIDLENEDETVTVLSDDETDDIIVLGSPAVPSVRSYKAVGSRRDQTSLMGDPTPGIIARALAELHRTQPPPAPATAPALAHPSTVPSSPANMYGGNIYNPNAGDKAEKKKGLRPIIIDASNVAMGHGNGKVFSCRGIEICVNYFLKRKHKVFAFLPMFRRHNIYTKDAHLLDKLQADNHLIFTPSRYVDGQSDVPYDDRYIVQTAAELGGVIVSTDNYRDLLRENPHWHDTIKNRLLMFTWVEDLLIFPQDPLGRRGCRLEEFLRF